MQQVFEAARSGHWERQADGTVSIAGHTLSDREFELSLNPTEGTTSAALRANDALVALDTAVSVELAAEGIARDVVRVVQAERKNQDLDVTDRISLTVKTGSGRIEEAVTAHRAFICEQTLAIDLELDCAEGYDVLLAVSEDAHEIDAGWLQILLAKAG